MTVELEDDVAIRVRDFTRLAVSFFVHRDEMNAAVHAAGIRHSPITDEALLARDAMEEAVGSRGIDMEGVG